MKRTFSRFSKTVVRSRSTQVVASAKLAIGTDLVWIPGIEQSVQQFGQRFLRRLFTLRELDYCHNKVNGAFRFDRLAARFAAKEAVMKLLRPSKDEVLPWQSIEIVADENGAPVVLLAPELRRRYQQSGIYQIVLSLSHDHEYATASAIAVPVAVI
ncbi:holo-ACP synthase [Undibacterium sp. Xuan67W]|uniref:holo-ACP synthase n=1 Tax=Undibacterium sp. Xuan67W TaxID=3413057 RepID=UPI003BF2EACB